MRKSYMTLCMRGNTEVTHILRNGKLEVTFEQAVSNGFNTLVLNDKGQIVKNDGFNSSDIAFFKDFFKKNYSTMIAEARGEF